MTDFQSPGRSALIASNGAVATSHPLAAKVAVEMLESGGNAVDAAIAGAILLGVCEPHMCGLGGDMFALVKPAGSEEIVGINASGRAPAGLDAAALRAGGAEEMPEIDAFLAHAALESGEGQADALGRSGDHRPRPIFIVQAIFYSLR